MTKDAFTKFKEILNKSIGYKTLEKGLKGDWQKEGYEMWASPNPVFDENGEDVDDDPKSFTVYAQHPKHGDVGEARFRIDNNKLIPDDSDGDDAVYVHPNHQRKGLASGMYKEAENFSGLKVSPSSWQTDEGKALWNQPNKPFGKSEPLEKRSKNVREQTRNITPEQALARRLKYAMGLGLNPRDKLDAPKDYQSYKGTPNNTGNTLTYGNAFPIEHEAAHAIMTPKGSNIQQYTNKLTDEESTPEAKTEENIANRVENLIDRRSGVGVGLKGGKRAHANTMRSNIQVPVGQDIIDREAGTISNPAANNYIKEHNLGENQSQVRNMKEVESKKVLRNAFHKMAQKYINKFDQGAKFNTSGEITESNNINTKINQKVNKSMDDKLQKMCNYLKKAKANKSEALEKEGGMISNANAQMDNPITSAISSAASAVGNWFSGDSGGGSGKAAGANLDRSTLDHNSGAMKNAFRKSKKILEKAKMITPEDVIKQYNAPKIKTKTTQNVMTYQDKEPKENVLKYDEINKIKTKPSTSGINYQELKAPIDNESKWKKKMKMGKSEEDNDSQMADSDLKSVNHHSQEIKQNLNPKKDLPDWVDSKINTSANEMSDVAHYLESNPQDSKKQMTEVLKKCKMKMAKAWKPFMD